MGDNDYTIFFVAILMALGGVLHYVYKIFMIIRSIHNILALIHMSMSGFNPMASAYAEILRHADSSTEKS